MKKRSGLFSFAKSSGKEDEKGVTVAASRKMNKQERIELLESLAALPGNQKCADCYQTPVTYLSTNLGVFLCSRCGELHRDVLPDHISIPVSLSQDALHERNAWVNHPIAPDILHYLSVVGNTVANARWEATIVLTEEDRSSENIEQYIKEKYVQRDYVKEEVFSCKISADKKKKPKKKFVIIDDNEKNVLIFEQDPRAELKSNEAEIQPEFILNLQETTLQFDAEAETVCFTLSCKGAEYLVECSTRGGLFDVMFAIHRVWENVMEASAFHLGKWLDRIGFQSAIHSLDLKKVKEYCEEDEKYCMVRNDRNFTPLHIACNEGQMELASLLLDYNVDVQFRNTSGATALHYFFGRKVEDLAKSMAFLEKVCQKCPNIDWNATNNGGASYLHFAVQVNSTDLAIWLVEKGANADHANDRGFTPLLTAVWQNQVDVVRVMLDKGADIFVKTKQGKSALELAQERKCEAMYDMLFAIWEDRRIHNQTNVINEILTTESDYIDRLTILVDIYKKSMESELRLSPKAIKALFSNVDDIFKASCAFNKDIQPVRDLPPEKKDIGARFVRNLAYFQMYIPYCTNQSISMKSLDIAMTHPAVSQFVKEKEAQNKERLRSEKIDGFLIKPLQRITRFPLLLRELQRYTPETHEDSSALKEACNHLAEIVGKANEAKRERDHIDEIMETFAKQGIQWSLTSRLVREGSCGVLGLDSKLDSTLWFLFTDVFVIAKPSKGDAKYKISNLVILSTLPLLWEVQGKEASSKLSQYSFAIVLPDRSDVRITICLKSKEEQQSLMALLATLVMQFMSENEKKALLASKKGLAMDIDGNQNVVVSEKDKDRPIFFEEIFQEGSEPRCDESVVRKEREKISFDVKLLRRVGIEKDDNVFDKIMKGQRGQDLDRKAIFNAIRAKDVPAVRTLLEQNSEFCHVKEKGDVSPLHVACQTGQLEVVQMLIDHGSDLSLKDKKGMTPFHCFFLAKFDSVPVAEALLNTLTEAIEEGFVDFDAPNNIGNTCLHCAVEGEGRGQLVPWLIRKGNVDPNAQNKNGETPLYIAIQTGNLTAVTNLLTGGADVWVNRNSGESLVTVAHECGDTKIWQAVLRRLNDRSWVRPPPPKKAQPRQVGPRSSLAAFEKRASTMNRSSDRISTNSPMISSSSSPSPSSSPLSTPSASPSPQRLSIPRTGSTIAASPSSASAGRNAMNRRSELISKGEVQPRQSPIIVSPSQDSLALDESKGKSPVSSLADSGTLPVISYADIKVNREHLDCTRLEAYLSDNEFVHVFGITREEFNKKPAWKRTIMKKDVDLF